MNPLELQAGLWEAVSDYEYKLLEISDKGQHRLIMLNIVSGFEHGNVHLFTDESIACSSTECIVANVKKARSNESIRLMLTPYLDSSYKAVEVVANEEGQPIIAYTYQLDRQDNKSTVRRFIESHKHKMNEAESNSGTGLLGLWIGTVRVENNLDLAVLNVTTDGKSHFSRFINGTDLVNTVFFESKTLDLSLPFLTLDTEHPTFANKIMIHKLSSSMISGYMYSIYKQQLIQGGTFTLFRLRQ